MDMEKKEKGKDARSLEETFVIYDPDNLPYMRLCTCDILRELPELSAEDIAGFKDK